MSVPLTCGCGGDRGKVVAIEGDVEGADGDLLPLHLLDLGGDPLRERDAAGADADQHQAADAAVALDDLDCHPPNDPRHLLGVEDCALRRQVLGHASARFPGSGGSYGRRLGLVNEGKDDNRVSIKVAGMQPSPSIPPQSPLPSAHPDPRERGGRTRQLHLHLWL